MSERSETLLRTWQPSLAPRPANSILAKTAGCQQAHETIPSPDASPGYALPAAVTTKVTRPTVRRPGVSWLDGSMVAEAGAAGQRERPLPGVGSTVGTFIWGSQARAEWFRLDARTRSGRREPRNRRAARAAS